MTFPLHPISNDLLVQKMTILQNIALKKSQKETVLGSGNTQKHVMKTRLQKTLKRIKKENNKDLEMQQKAKRTKQCSFVRCDALCDRLFLEPDAVRPVTSVASWQRNGRRRR